MGPAVTGGSMASVHAGFPPHARGHLGFAEVLGRDAGASVVNMT